MVHGGRNEAQRTMNDTWWFSGNRWTRLHLLGAPPCMPFCSLRLLCLALFSWVTFTASVKITAELGPSVYYANVAQLADKRTR